MTSPTTTIDRLARIGCPPAHPPMPIDDLISHFGQTNGLKIVTEDRYRAVVKMFAQFIGHAPTVADLTEASIDAFGDALAKDRQRTATSKMNYKSNLRTLWRFAHKYGETDSHPRYQWAQMGFKRSDLKDVAAGDTTDRTLAKVVTIYPTYREISRKYVENLQYVVVQFSRFLDRTATMDDLTDATVNVFLTWFAETGRAAETVNNARRTLLTLWRFCEASDWLTTLPRRVKKIRRPYKLVSAWSVEQIGAILEAASGDAKIIRSSWPLTWGDLLQAVVLLGCNSALRPCDMLAAKWANVTGDVLTIVQSKTGSPVSMALWPQTLAALEKIRHGRERLVGGRVNLKNLQIRFRELLRRLGVPGSLRTLRKTGATWANEQGIASQLLGHRSGSALAAKHYVDSRASVVRPVRPAGLLATVAPAVSPGSSPAVAPSYSPDECPWGTVDVGAGQLAGKDGGA